MAVFPASASTSSLTFEPDLTPVLPNPADLALLLDPSSHLITSQRQALASHAFRHALAFADLPLLAYLLHNKHARDAVDMDVRDEDGRGAVSVAIMGFGTEEAEREVEREECCRLLVAEGLDMVAGDHAGWTPLHYAALVAPPTLISYFLSYCPSHSTAAELLSSTTTRSNLTPLDVITAHSPIPGREGVALMLEEAMGVGGSAGRARIRRELREAEQRRKEERAQWMEQRRKCLMEWGLGGWGEESETDDDAEDDTMHDFDSDDETSTSPTLTWDAMLAFSLPSLPSFLNHIITQQPPILNPASRRSIPAHTLWLCARFAITWADVGWLEELVLGSLTRVEKLMETRSEDIPTLSFWAYNLTLLTYLLRTDTTMTEICDELDYFELLRESLHDIYVWITRAAERRIEPLLDSALLDFTPLGPSEGFDTPQFEDEWSFLKGVRDSLRKKRPPTPTPPSPSGWAPAVPPKDSPAKDNKFRSLSVPDLASHSSGNLPSATAEPKAFAELRKAISRPQTPSLFNSTSAREGSDTTSGPKSITALFSSLLLVLRLYELNPAFIIQIFSQIFLWMSSETFNRVLTRKKYLSRSKAMQIRMNISALEDWALREALPSSVVSKHFEPLNQLLQWLQCTSQIDQFSNLVATIQTMRRINPFQMRRAVRDYRYEVNESRMSEECTQYLSQLQRDWERRRVQLGVEELQKEMEAKARERGDEGSGSFSLNGDVDAEEDAEARKVADEEAKSLQDAQDAIDALFDPEKTMADWAPPEIPLALGELQNTRHVLPLLFPKDPRLLIATPVEASIPGVRSAGLSSPFLQTKRPSSVSSMASVASNRSSRQMEWKQRGDKAVRHTWSRLTQWVDEGSKNMRWEWDDYRGNGWSKAEVDSDEEEGDEVEEVEDALAREDSMAGSRFRSAFREPASDRHPLPKLTSSNHLDVSTAKSSMDSSLRTPSVNVDLTSPPYSPMESTPPSPTDILEGLRRSGSTKARRAWRKKRREGSDITVRPDDRTPMPLPESASTLKEFPLH